MPAVDTRQELEAQLAFLQSELKRREWLLDPSYWIVQRLGEVTWSRQREIIESVRDYRLTAVPSCHGAGKSWLAARLACWWIDTHPPGEAVVVTTATTWRQVEVVLWKELRRAHAKGKLAGRTNRTEWLMPLAGSTGEEQVAFGHRPSDNDPTAFQGVHERYVLVIFDEAGGIPKLLWDSALSLTANDESRFLAIGNPDDPLSEFAEVCKPGTGWHTIPVSAFDTPNFTDEEDVPDEAKYRLVSKIYESDSRRRWGITNPMYVSRVLGQFPEFSEEGLIPMHWIRAAQSRFGGTPQTHPIELGVDVGAGGDKNVIMCRWGAKAWVVHEDREPNTIQTARNIIKHARLHSAERVKVDYIGIGRGAVDFVKEQERADKKFASAVHGIQVGRPATDTTQYQNLRAEGYWHLRERFQNGEIAIDPNDDDLAAQLLDLRYENAAGRILIESKESMKRRGKVSPDRADALMLAFLPPPKRNTSATWGRK